MWRDRDLEELRLAELQIALPFFPQNGTILEVGAGAGWQARRLSELGFSVVAIDICESGYRAARVYEVINYDGEHVPSADGRFDVAFSSNVLEHIPNMAAVHAELARVLKPNGKAIHIVPSASWRFWTNLSHYLYLVKLVFSRRELAVLREKAARAEGTESGSSKRFSARRVLFAQRHGERGNFITELYYFSAWYWRRSFSANGWHVVAYRKGRLFYSGYGLFGGALSLFVRRLLSFIAGSSCHIFVLQPAKRG